MKKKKVVELKNPSANSYALALVKSLGLDKAKKTVSGLVKDGENAWTPLLSEDQQRKTKTFWVQVNNILKKTK